MTISNLPKLTPFETLVRDTRRTSAIRFNSKERLEREDRSITRLTTFLSIYLIGLAILPLLLTASIGTQKLVTFVSVFFAVVILAMALIQSADQRGALSEKMNRSALEIRAISREAIQYGDKISQSQLKLLYDRYHAVLERYSENHAEADWLKYQIDHSEEFPWLGKLKLANLKMQWQLSINTYEILRLIATTGFFLLALQFSI